jgi:hypothetical protein
LAYDWAEEQKRNKQCRDREKQQLRQMIREDEQKEAREKEMQEYKPRFFEQIRGLSEQTKNDLEQKAIGTLDEGQKSMPKDIQRPLIRGAFCQLALEYFNQNSPQFPEDLAKYIDLCELKQREEFSSVGVS